VLNVLPSDRSGRQLSKILESMALLRAEGRLPLQALVDAQAKNLPRGSTVILITPAAGDSVLLTVEHLQRRGMRPVAVLLDAASFGGALSSTRIAGNLASLKVPVFQVKNGDDLGGVLSAPGAAQAWG
jgi:hypothetical protein